MEAWKYNEYGRWPTWLVSLQAHAPINRTGELWLHPFLGNCPWPTKATLTRNAPEVIPHPRHSRLPRNDWYRSKSLPDSLPEMGQHLSTTCSRYQAEARVKLASPLPYPASLAPLVSCPETFNKSPPRDPSSQSLPPGAKSKRGS